jgi:AraC-like DNA-binding protein
VKRVTVGQLKRQPVGRFVGGRGWLHFCAHERLWGVVLFDRPDREAAQHMVQSFAVELGASAIRHHTLVDARRLESVDTSAFTVLQAFAARHLAQSRRCVERVAIVRRLSVEGAIATGFYGALGPPFEIAVFDSTRAALLWLGQPDVSRLENEIARATDAVRETPPLLASLRSLLLDDLASPDRGRIAQRLGVSTRTLQRRLREARSSFAGELRSLRLEEAKRRVHDTDDPITVVALELGFGSSQHFSRLFRRATGQSPTDWRARATRRGRRR